MGDMLGIPVITDPELPFSGWQLRDGDEVLAKGRFFEEPESSPLELPPLTFSHEYDFGYLSRWRQQALLPVVTHDMRQGLIITAC